MSKLLCLSILALIAISAFSAPTEDQRRQKGGRWSAKKCMGANPKPLPSSIQADQECKRLHKSDRICGRLCRLEKQKVIVNNRVNPKAWRHYISNSFPTIAMEYLAPLLTECSPKYATGTNSSSSPECSENRDFSVCVREAVEKVCSQPLPN